MHLDRLAQSVEFPCSQDAKKEIDQREFPRCSQECEDLAKYIAEELHYHHRLLKFGSIYKIQQAICQILQSKQ